MLSTQQLCHAFILASALAKLGLAAPLDSSDVQARQIVENSPHLAVLGDSFGSGVAFSQATTFDKNEGLCLRDSNAYAAQLVKDQGWSVSKKNTMQFAACSGAVLANMVKTDPQVAKIKEPVDAMIMTIGSNDVGFLRIVDACLLHTEITHDYGPAFPDEKGDCRKSIDFATNYIEKTFATDVRATYNDLLATQVAKNNTKLRMYHTGYPQFFNTLGKDAEDFCSAQNISFNVPIPPTLPGQPPFAAGNSRSILTKELRSQINILVQRVNDIIKEVTAEPAFNNKFGFIDINPAFNGHRFCEIGSNKVAQYYDENIWLWNVVAPVIGAIADNVGLPPTTFFSDPNFTYDNSVEILQQTLNDGTTVLGGSPIRGNKVIQGWRIRPFHPKPAAFKAMKDIIIARMKADKIPGA